MVLEFAIRDQRPKIPWRSFLCASNFESRRKWNIGMSTSKDLIRGRGLEVDGEDGVIHKATGLARRDKGLVRGPAHEELTSGMLHVSVSCEFG